jgi:hypothetical protein
LCDASLHACTFFKLLCSVPRGAAKEEVEDGSCDRKVTRFGCSRCFKRGGVEDGAEEGKVKDQRRRPEGGEWEPIKILMQELAYDPSSNPKAKTLQESDEHTNQHHRNDPLKIMNAAEKEWHQLDTRLARYDQNSEQTLLLKLPGGHVWPCTGYVRFRRIYPVNEPDMSGLPRTSFPTLILELRGTKMDETWTQGSPQHM